MNGARVDAEDLRSHLQQIVGAKRVSIDPNDIETYARDVWPRLLIGIAGGKLPEHHSHAVVWPENTREVAAIVRLARSLELPIIPYGGGSGVCGGVVPLCGGITVDLKRMKEVVGVSREDMTCDVEAGVIGERFERDLNHRGYTFGNFPSSIYCSTVGGWLATRAAGQMSTKYGKVEDRVAGLTVVTGRGDVVKTDGLARATRGPNWTQLFVGSEGTLGLITSARLRVSIAPELRVLRGFGVEDVAHGVEAIRRIMQRGLRPAVVRLYDEFDTFVHGFGDAEAEDDQHHHMAPVPEAGMGALPSLRAPSADAEEEEEGGGALTRMMGLLAARPLRVGAEELRSRLEGGGRGLSRLFSPRQLRRTLRQEAMATALSYPRMLNSLAGGVVDRFSRRGCLLIIGLEGTHIRTEVEARLTLRELERAGAKDLGEEEGRRWLKHRYSVSYKMPKVFRDGAFVDTMEVASTWERLLDMYEAVKDAISRHAFVMAHFSHAYTEGCSIYFTFAGHGEDRRSAERIYDAVWRDGLAATTRVGGTVSHHHGVGLLKAAYMNTEHREAMTVFRALKRSLDPDGIMNPGKLGLPLRAGCDA
jgi:alkyldihydroxyacetonephosphate synthase